MLSNLAGQGSVERRGFPSPYAFTALSYFVLR
jgi:hypothetical protein